ncbi:putative baseplate assembly protein [Ruminiclostridium herbifermentans]|uniref:Putative baseplate assembly protein n=1 Tax=Ruminiclostridium herbifermentans TaxID=2488810 RepID=A0A4U7JHG3_9FIRM|nr:putative baseplate assembly protein [Ruminiclostridium herbifermentans]QNU66041.1 putative baseplate assembly protein [Ruminiclostridium herbifermentans]
MLPQINLDDRTFKDMVESAKKMIPGLIPEWTDENHHDPGITLIELFAWLIEMQQYYLDRVTSRNELKFLKLLGIKPKSAEMAKSYVTFDNVLKNTFIPLGTPLGARDEIFETIQGNLLLSAKIEKVLSVYENQTWDYTEQNNEWGTAFYPFGNEAKKGSRLYIGLNEALPEGTNINISLNVFEDYPVPAVIPNEGEFIPSAKLLWKYYDGYEWRNVNIIKDSTYNLHFKGQLYFSIDKPMMPLQLEYSPEAERYWLCCIVEEGGYEIAPKLCELGFNTVEAIHRNTLCDFYHFSSTGKPNQKYIYSSHIALTGKCNIQVRKIIEGNEVWVNWERVDSLAKSEPTDKHFELSFDFINNNCVILFGDGENGKIPNEGIDNIRFITCANSFYETALIAESNGLPNQRIKTNLRDIIPDSFKIQVGRKPKGMSSLCWEDWVRVDSFDSSAPTDKHYILNDDTGEIIFGDNERGAIPQNLGINNISIISCQTGGMEKGNVKTNEINEIYSEIDSLRDINVLKSTPAEGGKNKESIQDAKQRARRDLKKLYKAVTCEDYEEIAKMTPGLRVAKVKAIPLYEPGLKGYPTNHVEAKVCIVAVPYSTAEKPLPSKAFLENMRRHLDKFRLITTELEVVPPEYVKITVSATVVVEQHINLNSQKVKDALKEMLSPVGSGEASEGWDFGRTVYKGDIYGRIKQIEGVEYVRDLKIQFEGRAAEIDSGGDIRLHPHAIVYSGEHKIHVINKTKV